METCRELVEKAVKTGQEMGIRKLAIAIDEHLLRFKELNVLATLTDKELFEITDKTLKSL